MRKLEEQMKTLGTARWLSSPTLLQFISGPGEVANDYNALESIHAPRGQFQKLEVLFIKWTAEHRTLLSLDASHVIPPRVLRFGPSRHRASHPVRPPLLGGLTGLDAATPRRAFGLGFRLNQGTSSGFVVNH